MEITGPDARYTQLQLHKEICIRTKFHFQKFHLKVATLHRIEPVIAPKARTNAPIKSTISEQILSFQSWYI